MKKPQLLSQLALVAATLTLHVGTASRAAAQITKEAGPTYGLAFGMDRNTFYYRVWRGLPYGSASITIGYPELGRFTGKWNNVQDMTVGKGWGTNGNDTKKFTFRVNKLTNSPGSMTLGVYGWTTGSGYGVGANEFYIDERWTGNNPGAGNTYVGGFQADGSSYAVYRQVKLDKPTPVGFGDFLQYRSVRASQRTSGTVQTKLHFNYWKGLTGGRAYRLNGFLYSTFGVEAMDFTNEKASGECDVWITSSNG